MVLFTFSIALLVRVILGRPNDLDKLIEPFSRIGLEHRSMVKRVIVPLRSWKTFVVPSDFSYFESTNLSTSLLFMIENGSVILGFYRELIWVFFKKKLGQKSENCQRYSKDTKPFIISGPPVICALKSRVSMFC